MEANQGRTGTFNSLGLTHILQLTGCLGGVLLLFFNQLIIFAKISDQLPRFSAVVFP